MPDHPPPAGGAEFRHPWRFLIGLSIIALTGATFLIYCALKQPIDAVGALLGAAALVLPRRQTRPRAWASRTILGGIAGGAIVQFAQYLIAGASPGAADPLSLVVGALGIGGTVGLFTAFGAVAIGAAVIFGRPVLNTVLRARAA